jgi:hypothetical protein
MLRRLALVSCLCVALPAFADDKDKKGGAPPQMSKEEAAAMEAMMKHGTPGDPHKVFERLAGKWEYVGKWWMSPDKPPMEMHGTSEGKVIMDGRFYTESVKGTDPQFPFEGKGWWGYDNHKKKYVYAWIDSMTTSIATGEGEYDAKSNTLTWHAQMFDPAKGKEVTSKEVTQFKGDTIVRSFYYVEGGKDVKAMELTIKRAK